MRRQQYLFRPNASRASLELINIINMAKFGGTGDFPRDLPFRVFRLQETQIRLPLVANDLAAGKTTDWNNHLV